MATLGSLGARLAQATNVRLALIGAGAAGLVLGLLVWFFLTHLSGFEIAALSTIVGIIASGAMAAFIDKMKGGSEAIATYAIGLAAGSLLYLVLAVTNLDDNFGRPGATPTQTPEVTASAAPT